MGVFDPEKKYGVDTQVEIPVGIDLEKEKASGIQFNLGCTFNDWHIWKVSGNTSFSIEDYLVNSGYNCHIFSLVLKRGFLSPPQNPHH